MDVPNQLLMTLHDAVWAAAYAQSGIEADPPSLRSTLMADLAGGRGAGSDTPPKRQKTAAEIRAEVATRVRT